MSNITLYKNRSDIAEKRQKRPFPTSRTSPEVGNVNVFQLCSPFLTLSMILALISSPTSGLSARY